MTEPRTPRTEAGRWLIGLLDPQQEQIAALIRANGMEAQPIDYRPFILAIEAEAFADGMTEIIERNVARRIEAEAVTELRTPRTEWRIEQDEDGYWSLLYTGDGESTPIYGFAATIPREDDARLILTAVEAGAAPPPPCGDEGGHQAMLCDCYAEAGAAPPIDVERLADALTAAPSLLLEGDDRDRKEFAEWLLSRLSGSPPEPKP